MRFIIDESTGQAVVEYMRTAGHDAQAVADMMLHAADIDILQHAVAEDCIVITNDKDFGELVFRIGLVNTLWPLILPAWFGYAFFIFLPRQFFMSIPQELDDAARMDGASTFQIFTHIILPLSKPALAAVAIFGFIGIGTEPVPWAKLHAVQLADSGFEHHAAAGVDHPTSCRRNISCRASH